MIDLFRAWWDFGLYLIATAPPAVTACFLGMVISWAFTQSTKWLWPYSWSANTRHLLVQLQAFVSGFLPTFSLLRETHAEFGVVLAIAVGLCAPYSWSIFVGILGRYKPEWKQWLSQDHRPRLDGDKK